MLDFLDIIKLMNFASRCFRNEILHYTFTVHGFVLKKTSILNTKFLIKISELFQLNPFKQNLIIFTVRVYF